MKTLLLLAIMFVVSATVVKGQVSTGFFFTASDGRTTSVNTSEYLFVGATDGSHLEFNVEKAHAKWLMYFQSPQGESLLVGTKYFINDWTVDYSKLNSWNTISGQPVGMFILENWDMPQGQFPTKVSGSFTILELEYNVVTGVVSSFAVNFQQFNVGVADRGPDSIYGSIRYNSAIALSDGGTGYLSAIPEPSTYAAIAGALMLGVAVWFRRKAKPDSSVFSAS